MIKNLNYKKVVSKTRKVVKITTIAIIAALLTFGIINFVYKQTYSVSLNGEIIGYTNNKFGLQQKINDYIATGKGENVAFVKIEQLPVYEACLLRKNIETNDEELFKKIIAGGTTYYKYYAIADSDEEKAYLGNFSDAESVVNQLKEKDSANKDDLTIVEKYNTQLATLSTVDDTVNNLYEKRYKVVSTRASAYTNIGTQIVSSTQYPTDLGVTLIEPVEGVITSRFGIRSRDNHKGLDIGTSTGTAIKAAVGGTVIASGMLSAYSGYGNIVVVQTNESLVIRYGHCSKVYVQEGEHVAQGQIIAAVGSTGISTGPHLHFEIRYDGVAINPQNYVYKGR